MSKPITIIFTKAGLIDGRCGLARAIKGSGANKDKISFCNFSFSKDGHMDKNCEGYIAIKEILGDVDIFLKGEYVKPQGKEGPGFKFVHKKFPDEYIEVVLNYIPETFVVDQSFWDALIDVVDGELNVVPEGKISPLESLDEEIIKCIEEGKNLPSENAAKRLKEVWDELVLLPVDDKVKEYARELFNSIKDDKNHVIVRKNAVLNKKE